MTWLAARVYEYSTVPMEHGSEALAGFDGTFEAIDGFAVEVLELEIPRALTGMWLADAARLC